MKRTILILLTLMMAIGVQAQKKGWSFEWNGMINPHFYVDSREVVGGREDMMLFYPKPIELDSIGNDINAHPSFNMLSITARVGLKINAPNMLGAHVFGYIEGDFTGSRNTTINSLRLRHAYINMEWANDELLIGQYWYPMTIHEIMPGTCPLNMGAPFHPYARYSQVRYTRHLGNWELIGVAAFQLDNMSQGHNGASTEYIRNSCIPEFNLQFRYRGEHLLVGIAGNLLTIKPRKTVTDNLGMVTTTDKLLASTSATAFVRYDWNNWSLKAQTLLDDNLYEGCTMGGYWEHYIYNEDNGKYEYTYNPWNYTTIWADFGRTKGHWRPGIFVGYGYNNDFGLKTNSTSDNVYGRGFNMEYLYRVQPRVSYCTNFGLNFTAEVEYTHAQYGKEMFEDVNKYYAHDNCGGVDHLRLMLDILFAF